MISKSRVYESAPYLPNMSKRPAPDGVGPVKKPRVKPPQLTGKRSGQPIYKQHVAKRHKNNRSDVEGLATMFEKLDFCDPRQFEAELSTLEYTYGRDQDFSTWSDANNSAIFRKEALRIRRLMDCVDKMPEEKRPEYMRRLRALQARIQHLKRKAIQKSSIH